MLHQPFSLSMQQLNYVLHNQCIVYIDVFPESICNGLVNVGLWLPIVSVCLVVASQGLVRRGGSRNFSRGGGQGPRKAYKYFKLISKKKF